MVCEKPELAFLAVQRWPVVDHLRVDFHLKKKTCQSSSNRGDLKLCYLVNPLHVIPQLFQVLDVAIADFANDKITLAPALASTWLARFDSWRR